MTPQSSDHGQVGARSWTSSSSFTPRQAPLAPGIRCQVPGPSLHSGLTRQNPESLILSQALLGLILETALPELHHPDPNSSQG